MELNRIRAQNPHWDDAGCLAHDLHLSRVEQSPLALSHPLLHRLDIENDGITVIRGPRQAGKTTLVKQVIKSLILQGTSPGRILYFAFDTGGLRDHNEVLDLLRTFFDFAGKTGAGRTWVFLDEVT